MVGDLQDTCNWSFSTQTDRPNEAIPKSSSRINKCGRFQLLNQTNALHKGRAEELDQNSSLRLTRICLLHLFQRIHLSH